MTTILVIEDNEMNLTLMETILEANGFDLLLAATGEAGLNLFEGNQVDLILLDLQLPDIDGYEVLRQIKEAAQAETVKVVAVTGNATAVDQERALAAGFDDFLKKPFRIDGLLTCLHRNL